MIEELFGFSLLAQSLINPHLIFAMIGLVTMILAALFEATSGGIMIEDPVGSSTLKDSDLDLEAPKTETEDAEVQDC